MNYMLVRVAATSTETDLTLKLFASPCVPFFKTDIFPLSIGIAQEFILVYSPRKEPMIYYVYVRQKQTKFVREVYTTPSP